MIAFRFCLAVKVLPFESKRCGTNLLRSIKIKPETKLKREERLRIKPAIFIPTLYFAEGLPYTIVTLMSVVFFKNLEATNSFISWSTSLLALPWTLKFLWSPLVDVYGTKKRWIVVAQIALGGLTVLLSLGCFLPETIYVSLILFLTIAIASATHDIAIDGYYMDVLNKEEQAYF